MELTRILMLAAITLCVSTSAANGDGPIGHWTFDESEGLIVHDTVAGRHGIIHGAEWTIGQVGDALWFDGVDDYVELPDNEPVWLPGDNFSLAVWVYFERRPGLKQEYILDLNHGISADPSYELAYGLSRGSPGSDGLSFRMTTMTDTDDDLQTTDVFPEGRWYHVVAVRGGTTQAIYVNGQLNASRTCTPDSIDFVGSYDNDKVSIGRFSQALGLPFCCAFMGMIDDVRIYNKALSAEEVRQLHEGQEQYVAVDIKPGSCPNPLNLGSRGVLPVAILGSEEFDVGEIDVASVSLAGVNPARSSYEDVASPLADGSECDCTEEGGDGFTDLTLKFKTAEVAEELLNTIGDVNKGELLVLPLTASLLDGTPIEGDDCVRIAGKVPRALAAKKADVDGDGIINIYDFAVMANYWLEYAAVDY
jgi:hypothetical protein